MARCMSLFNCGSKACNAERGYVLSTPFSSFFKRALLVLSLVLSFLLSHPSVALADGFVQGVLLDRTHSMKGQEFFSKFSLEWNQVPQSKNVNVTVSEGYSPRKGTSVTIFVEEKQVFQIPLIPRKPVDAARVTAAKNAAAQAARAPRAVTIF